ncbi:MAG: ribbon-helix-helix protein, CopG family [Pseudomonadota bacterium]
MRPAEEEVTIRMPVSLKRRLEAEAARADVTLGALVREALTVRGGGAGQGFAESPDVWRPGWRPSDADGPTPAAVPRSAAPRDARVAPGSNADDA